MITGATAVARLLEEHPQLVEFLASYHPHFEKLRRGLLRKIMAPRVTVEQAARMAGMCPDDLLAAIRRQVGEAESPGASTETVPDPGTPPPRPALLAARRSVHVDVRDDIQRGIEPFARIMAAVKGPSAVGAELTIDVRGLEPPLPMVRVLERLDVLDEGARLEVIHDRRPVFLYPQLDERGFAHETDELEPGVVRIRIKKRPGTER